MILCCLEYFVYACSHVIKPIISVNCKLKKQDLFKKYCHCYYTYIHMYSDYVYYYITRTLNCVRDKGLFLQEVRFVSNLSDGFCCLSKSFICRRFNKAIRTKRSLEFKVVFWSKFGRLQLYRASSCTDYSANILHCTDTLQRCLEDKLVITFYSGCRRVNRGSPILQAGCKNSVLTVHCYY